MFASEVGSTQLAFILPVLLVLQSRPPPDTVANNGFAVCHDGLR